MLSGQTSGALLHECQASAWNECGAHQGFDGSAEKARQSDAASAPRCALLDWLWPGWEGVALKGSHRLKVVAACCGARRVGRRAAELRFGQIALASTVSLGWYGVHWTLERN
jgi:hypothetical protein